MKQTTFNAIITALIICSSSITIAADNPAEDAAKLDKACKTMAEFTSKNIGGSQGDLNYISELVVAAAKDPAQRKAMEKRLCSFLEGQATDEGKSLACKHLVIVGSPDCVPAVAKLLTSEKLSHMARYVLERIPGDASVVAMRDAMGNVKDKLKIGMIHSLGRRGDQKSVGEFEKIAGGSSEELAAAALMALSRIDSEKAVKAVAEAWKSAKGKLRETASDAYLAVADRYRSEGKNDEAVGIYEQMFAETEPVISRVAGLRGLTAVGGKKVIKILMVALSDKDAKIQAVAVMCLREVPGGAATLAIAEELDKQPVPVQAQLLLVLGDRGGAEARAAVMQALKSTDTQVRVAALQGVGKIGDASSVLPVAELAASAPDLEKADARNALDRLSSDGVNKAMIDQLGKGNPAVQLELVRSLGARGAAEAVPALLGTAQGADSNVRQESLRQLRKMADAANAPAMAGLLLKMNTDAERTEAENAVITTCMKIPDADKRAEPVLNAWKNAAEVPAKRSVLRVLGQIGDGKTLGLVAAAAADASADVRDSAIRAMAEWPNSEPMPHLEKLAKDAASETHRVLALRGYIRMVDMNPDLGEKEMVDTYEKAMAMSARTDEKKQALAKLAEMRCQAALDLAKKTAGDAALREAAEVAAKKIEENMKKPLSTTASANADKAGNALDGRADTRWDTGASQKGGEWFLLDLGTEKTITKITLDTAGSGGDYPRGYEVYISKNRQTSAPPVVKGEGKGPVTEIKIDSKVGRFIKIVQTGKVEGLFWSIHELKVETK